MLQSKILKNTIFNFCAFSLVIFGLCFLINTIIWQNYRHYEAAISTGTTQ